MAGYRKFYLQNAAGTRVDLNGLKNVLATDPTGLGSDLSPVFGDLTGGFFKLLSNENEPQTPVGMKINFTNKANAYSQFQSLARFISAAGDGLTLVYCPIGSVEYYRDVSLSYLKKTEKARTGWLTCQAEFLPLTPWYLPSSLSVDLAPVLSDAMRYSWRYDTDRYVRSHSANYSATLSPAGDIPAALQIVFEGAINTPLITLTGMSTGTVYGRCQIDKVLHAGDVLEYSSAKNNAYVRLLSGGVTEDLDNEIDLDTDPFFFLPLTETCDLSITGIAISGEASVKVLYYYRTV